MNNDVQRSNFSLLYQFINLLMFFVNKNCRKRSNALFSDSLHQRHRVRQRIWKQQKASEGKRRSQDARGFDPTDEGQNIRRG